MANALHTLANLGQSVWYDNIRRGLLASGELARYRRDYAVSGVTSNPTIFQDAIANTGDYDDALRDAVDRGVRDPEELFWSLATDDIRDAADVLRPDYDATQGVDGYVSLELPPRLSHDTEGSVAMAQQLFDRVGRPNVMIKVPGTPQGPPAVEELIARGVPVNITLLFSVSQWQAVADAYLRGLERRRDAGENFEVSSVTSFFISRIDAKANQRLPEDLHNRLGIANAHLAYGAYRQLLATERWRRLEEAGARPQRVLWASTSTKDPSLPEGYYVSALAAPDTVNTMPESTMLAFAEGGTVGEPLSADTSTAQAVADDVTAAGVDLDDLARELQDEGDRKFADSFDELLAGIEERTESVAHEVGA